jgi:hypothetical protein
MVRTADGKLSNDMHSCCAHHRGALAESAVNGQKGPTRLSVLDAESEVPRVAASERQGPAVCLAHVTDSLGVRQKEVGQRTLNNAGFLNPSAHRVRVPLAGGHARPPSSMEQSSSRPNGVTLVGSEGSPSFGPGHTHGRVHPVPTK